MNPFNWQNSYRPMIQPISDYATLSFAIANAIIGNVEYGKVCNYYPLCDIITEKYGEDTLNKISNCKCYYFILGIPGNWVNELYIVDTNSLPSFSDYYRVSNGLTQVIAFDISSNISKPQIGLDELGDFFNRFKYKLSCVFANDPHLTVSESGNYSYFILFAIIYMRYGLSKEDFLEMQNYMPKQISAIKEDNKVYENLVGLLTSRKNSEIMLQRCFSEGLNGKVPDNLLRSKIVPAVQETRN